MISIKFAGVDLVQELRDLATKLENETIAANADKLMGMSPKEIADHCKAGIAPDL